MRTTALCNQNLDWDPSGFGWCPMVGPCEHDNENTEYSKDMYV